MSSITSIDHGVKTEDEKRKLIDKLSPEDVLTARGGRIVLSDEERRACAILADGRVLIKPEGRWSSEVKAILRRAERAGISTVSMMEVNPKDITSLNDLHVSETSPAAGSETDSLLDRQLRLRQLIEDAARLKASDIHIYVYPRYAEVMFRIFNRMSTYEMWDANEAMGVIQAALAVASDSGAEMSEKKAQQGSLTSKSQILPNTIEMARLQYSPTTEGRGSLVMRMKPVPSKDEGGIEDLGYRADQIGSLKKMRTRTNGMYVLAGKTNSGKSTTLNRTLNAMVEEKRREISIYSIEEPIELDLTNAIQVGVAPDPTGGDAGLQDALKASLRSDVNVVVVGEIRTPATAKLAMRAVDTGHALWTTVHAGSALAILKRLSGLGVERMQLEDPNVIRGLIYQRLCGVICPHCRIDMAAGYGRGQIGIDLVREIQRITRIPANRLYLRGDGCPKCRNGLAGRTVVAEVIEPDNDLLEHFVEGRNRAMREHWTTPVEQGGLGGVPVSYHAFLKVALGQCDIREVEEEVDLLSSFVTLYPNLVGRLRQEIAAARPDDVRPVRADPPSKTKERAA